MDRTLLGTLLLCFIFTIRHLRKHIMCMLLSCDPTQTTCFAQVAEKKQGNPLHTKSSPLMIRSLYNYQPSSYNKRGSTFLLIAKPYFFIVWASFYQLILLSLIFRPTDNKTIYSRFVKPGRHFLVETDDSKEDKQDSLDEDDSE